MPEENCTPLECPKCEKEMTCRWEHKTESPVSDIIEFTDIFVHLCVHCGFTEKIEKAAGRFDDAVCPRCLQCHMMGDKIAESQWLTRYKDEDGRDIDWM